jgi:uncharacterized membrane protein
VMSIKKIVLGGVILILLAVPLGIVQAAQHWEGSTTVEGVILAEPTPSLEPSATPAVEDDESFLESGVNTGIWGSVGWAPIITIGFYLVIMGVFQRNKGQLP